MPGNKVGSENVVYITIHYHIHYFFIIFKNINDIKKNLSLFSAYINQETFFCCNYLIATIVIFEVFFFFFGRKSGNFGVLMSKKSGANVPQNILVLCALHSGYSAASIIIFLRCIAWLDFRCHSWLAAPPLGVGANYDHATLIKSMARQFTKK